MVTDEQDPTSRRLEELAGSDPHGLAFLSTTQTVTWAQLDAEADAVAARVLAVLGEEPACVAVRIKGYRALLATSVGVSRAGKTLIPVDPSLPDERAAQVLAEAAAVLVLSDLPALDLPQLEPSDWVGATQPTRTRRPHAEGLPYAVVFTSGSSGVPKGIAQGSAQTEGHVSVLKGTVGGRLQVFDVGSIGNYGIGIAAAIASSSTLVPYDVHSLGFAQMHVWLRDNAITIMGVVPTLIRLWLPSLPAGYVLDPLEIVFSYGESLGWSEASAFRAHLPVSCELRNVYGSTETSRISRFDIPHGATETSGRVPAGALADGVTVRLVDADDRDVPEGEIVVSSGTLALGYWRRPDLSEGTFLSDPDGRRWVRTGDGGRFDDDGNLHHLGRLDDVVKVSGHRIELGDVTAALRSLDGVVDATTTIVEDGLGGVRLRGFVILAEGAATTPALLRTALTRRLPGFMLPDTIEVRTSFPNLANGKLDRQALVSASPSWVPSLPHDASVVSSLQVLFEEVLEVAPVGADDDFFALGGDSLRAASLFALVQRRLGYDQPPTLLLDAATPLSLAQALISKREILVAGRVEGSLPPLFVVHGGGGDLLWLRELLAHLDPEQPVYGLVAPALDGLPPAEASLEQLAARYLAEIASVRRSGPLHVFGYSLGGLIAFAMASQAADLGEEIGVVAIGDIGASLDLPSGRAAVRAKEMRALRPTGAARLGVQLVANQVQHRRQLLRERRTLRRPLEATVAAAARGIPSPVEQRSDFLMKVYGDLAARYRPGPVAFDVVVLRTASTARDVADPLLGWQAVTPHVDLVDLPGDHDDLVHATIPLVGRALTAALASARAVRA